MQVFHTVLEIVCDGLHVIITDPYGERISVEYRLPKSNEYIKVSLLYKLTIIGSSLCIYLIASLTEYCWCLNNLGNRILCLRAVFAKY